MLAVVSDGELDELLGLLVLFVPSLLEGCKLWMVEMRILLLLSLDISLGLLPCEEQSLRDLVGFPLLLCATSLVFGVNLLEKCR